MKFVSILLATAMAAGVGAGHGWFDPGGVARTPAVSRDRTSNGSDGVVGRSSIREIKPIITNLAAPAGAWIRLELAAVVDVAQGGEAEKSIAQYSDDTVAYLRTLTATELEGATGIGRLREDLNERAALRGGPIREVLIETLVVQ